MLSPPRFGADSLTVAFRRLDLAQLRGTGPATSLTGTLAAAGTMDSATPPDGRLDVALDSGWVRELRFDSASARLRGESGRILVDTALVYWPGGVVSAAGALGWRAPVSDTIRILADISDLSSFDSLARSASGIGPDTTAEGDGRLGGSMEAELFLTGSVDTFELDARGTAPEARFAGYHGWNLRGEGSWSTAGPHFTAHIEADSVVRGAFGLTTVLTEAQGRPDSLTWSVSTAGRRFARLTAAGMLEQLPDHRHIQVDTLALDLLGRDWRLTRPAGAILVNDVFKLDTVRFATNDGSGSIEVVGDIPGRNPGQLTIQALGVKLRDLYGLAQRDTSEISGTVTLDLAVGGTSTAPTLRGLGTITGPVFRDFQAPLIRAGLDYRERQLRSNVTFWRAGKAVVDISADLPVDLAFSGVRRRQLPGPISIIALGDSVELALIEAFTPNLRQVRGRLNVDARVEGTWEAPRLGGTVGVVGGELTVPGLGVRYTALNGELRLTGDSIVAEGLSVESEPGRLDISGGVRLDGLTRPQFDLTMDAREFRIMDVDNYMSLTGWGTVRIAGTVFRPVLTGEGALTNSVVYFTDLLTKRIINLEDPRLADLVDTLALREDDLRAPFQSQFLDSLAIRDLELRLGQGVWLRSTEANVQLEGRLNISKTRDAYQVSGDLQADRGTYTLRLPGLVRTFTVERGSIRYTNDLNAAVDILARHDVRTPGERIDVPIHANITGRLFAPKLRLTSPERPGLSEPEIISLLALGTTDIQGGTGGLAGGDRAALAQAVAAYFSSVLASEAQSKVSEGGYVVELRPPLASSGLSGGGSAAQLSLGRALTDKLFVIANAGFCLSGQQAIDPRNLGASIEYRFRRELRALIAAEPITSCYGQGVNLYGPPRRYQFGAELRWDREY
jgi:autotransporter translocation and assembly factor TamB